MLDTHNLYDVEIKDVTDSGTFTGIASVYGVEDLVGDVIDKGAFKKTISENPEVPILWQHDPREVIGRGLVKEWQNKIMLDGRLDLSDTVAAKAYSKIKQQLIKGLSIGFRPIKWTYEEVKEGMIRHLTEIQLMEVSLVTFPALPIAGITRVKALEENALRARVETLEQLYQQVSALLAAKSTPTEPEKATEPPPPSIEPDYHSLLLSSIRNFKL